MIRFGFLFTATALNCDAITNFHTGPLLEPIWPSQTQSQMQFQLKAATPIPTFGRLLSLLLRYLIPQQCYSLWHTLLALLLP